MDMNSMQYFITVIDQASMTCAARELFITPQGLAQALSRLESEYGSKLFYREGKRIMPTEAGKILYQTFTQIISLNQSANEQLRDSNADALTNDQKNLTVFSAPIFTELILPELLPSFCKRNPNVRLRIIEFPSPEINNIPVKPQNTICLFSTTPSNVDAVCMRFSALSERHILSRTPVLACMSKKSPLSGKAVVNREDLSDKDIVLCRNDGYFLRAIIPAYDGSRIAVRSQSKTLGFSILSENKNTVGFTSCNEFYYFRNRPLTCALITPRLETIFGYLSGDLSEASPYLRRFADLIEKEFAKIARDMAAQA